MVSFKLKGSDAAALDKADDAAHTSGDKVIDLAAIHVLSGC